MIEYGAFTTRIYKNKPPYIFRVRKGSKGIPSSVVPAQRLEVPEFDIVRTPLTWVRASGGSGATGCFWRDGSDYGPAAGLGGGFLS